MTKRVELGTRGARFHIEDRDDGVRAHFQIAFDGQDEDDAKVELSSQLRAVADELDPVSPSILKHPQICPMHSAPITDVDEKETAHYQCGCSDFAGDDEYFDPDHPAEKEETMNDNKRIRLGTRGTRLVIRETPDGFGAHFRVSAVGQIEDEAKVELAAKLREVVNELLGMQIDCIDLGEGRSCTVIALHNAIEQEFPCVREVLLLLAAALRFQGTDAEMEILKSLRYEEGLGVVMAKTD